MELDGTLPANGKINTLALTAGCSLPPSPFPLPPSRPKIKLNPIEVFAVWPATTKSNPISCEAFICLLLRIGVCLVPIFVYCPNKSLASPSSQTMKTVVCFSPEFMTQCQQHAQFSCWRRSSSFPPFLRYCDLRSWILHSRLFDWIVHRWNRNGQGKLLSGGRLTPAIELGWPPTPDEAPSSKTPNARGQISANSFIFMLR